MKLSIPFILFTLFGLSGPADAEMLSPQSNHIPAHWVTYAHPGKAVTGEKPRKKSRSTVSITYQTPAHTAGKSSGTTFRGHSRTNPGNTTRSLFSGPRITRQQATRDYVSEAERAAHEGGGASYLPPDWLNNNHVTAQDDGAYLSQERNIANRDAIRMREDEIIRNARIARNPRAEAIRNHLDAMSRQLTSTAKADARQVASQTQP
ncbi:hypothetical protein ACJU26_09355 [Acidithiobacillus sp. M4-SHS-6]|uniref:hypothetical protein n=1 Tax=Acidithiobacillus sp. M4-SHS-6 TaxID=3383024 RepID=UPI0039BDF8C6